MEPLSQLQENQAKSKVSLFDIRFMLQIVSRLFNLSQVNNRANNMSDKNINRSRDIISD